MTLSTLVAELRRDLASGDGRSRPLAAAALGRLAAEGVPGADPASWWALRGVTDTRPLRQPEEPVRVSPSKIEAFGKCQLRWLFSACGADGPAVGAAGIGTLVHDIAAEVGDADEATLRAEVDARWGRLGLPPGWVSERKRAEAQAMVGRLARYFDRAAREGWERLGAELAMEVTLGRAVLTGRVDRLERLPDGSLRVIDYKTGSASSKPREDDLPGHPQLGAYQLAVGAGAFAEHGMVCGGAALLQIGKGATKRDITLQEQAPLPTHDDPDWARRLLAETAEGMAGARFTATVGPWCDQCSVRASCPVQPEGKTL